MVPGSSATSSAVASSWYRSGQPAMSPTARRMAGAVASAITSEGCSAAWDSSLQARTTAAASVDAANTQYDFRFMQTIGVVVRGGIAQCNRAFTQRPPGSTASFYSTQPGG